MAKTGVGNDFWRIFHSILRSSAEQEEVDRSQKVMIWAQDNVVKLKAVCGGCDQELELFQLVWKFWLAHKKAPTLNIMRDIVQQMDKAEPLIEELENYTSLREDLPSMYDPGELDQVLLEKTIAFELEKLNTYLTKTMHIANNGMVLKKDGDVVKGPREALLYLNSKLQQGILVEESKALGGNLKVTAKNMEMDYRDNKYQNDNGNLIIKTGVREIDDVMSGLKRGTFTGILGYAGTHKSTVGRSFVYEAVQQGFNVIHIPLEISPDEERNIYGIMHSHHLKFESKFNLTVTSYENGNLTPEEEDFLFNTVVPDLDNLPGELIIRKPNDTSWEGIRNEIELQNKITPIDLVFIDYLALMDTSSSRDPRGYINDIIKKVKIWAMSFDDNRQVAVVTPVQGSRQGRNDAADNDGAWSMSGVYDFSEFDRTLDTCFYTFKDPQLDTQSKIKMGTSKVRRSQPILPFEISLSPFSRKLVSISQSSIVMPSNDDNTDAIDDLF
jgi:replicative DNA helicase